MDEKKWWQMPLRVIQYNLQVKDTPKMNPRKIAQDLEDLAANAVVINVGGIYAWYDSRVPFHHVNEYLPKDMDLLGEIIAECHLKNIRVIARFDFSKTDDTTYLQKPEWFVRNKDRSPQCLGSGRMGEWSLLMSTCLNGGYRNEAVAQPVLREVLGRYEIDGIFYNAMQYIPCWCDGCRKKYKAMYGVERPDEPSEWAPDWKTRCEKDNLTAFYRLVKEKNPALPIIMYYFAAENGDKRWHTTDLDERYQMADLICTEAQDELSHGVNDIPQNCGPAITMKIGQIPLNRPRPFGIIHSSPGMDWRHAGLPYPEYRFWMSQVPANNGILWHSLTGFNDTIGDKRILAAIKEVNEKAALCEDDMLDAKSLAQVLVLWDGLGESRGWAEALVNTQIPFDLCNEAQLSETKLAPYPLVLVPNKFPLSASQRQLLKAYIKEGGAALFESVSTEDIDYFADVLGIEGTSYSGEDLTASYLAFEEPGLQAGMEETPLIPYRGGVVYCRKSPDARALLTLIPPFAPLDGVGAPPERASLPVAHTDLPMCIENTFGKGTVVFLPLSVSKLIRGYRLKDHFTLVRNIIYRLLGDKRRFLSSLPAGVQFTPYRTPANQLLLHFVNGVGQRPLQDNIPLYNVELSVKLGEGERIISAESAFGGEVSFRQVRNVLHIAIKKLDVWEMIRVSVGKS